MKLLKHSGFVFLILTIPVAIISCNPGKNYSEKPIPTIDSLQDQASVNPYISIDQSPMDMSYYPPDYPILKMDGTDSAKLIARLIYSRPQKKGRALFGYDGKKSLREYGKEWRLGANEATEIEFFRNVRIADKDFSAGRYIIYCVPYPDKWVIILNSNLYTWGLHVDSSKDIFKLEIPLALQSPPIEDFTMIFETGTRGMDLVMAWDSVRAVLPIKFID